jgi:hypothetical protein
MERVRDVLAAQPGVTHAEVNPSTGSVLVHGLDPRKLETAMNEALTLVKTLQGESPEAGVDQLVGLVQTADQRLREVTGGRVSLRWFVPTAFVAVGVRQLLQQGFTVGTVPWYVLLYYGVDSFIKLFPEHAPSQDAGMPPSAPGPAE